MNPSRDSPPPTASASTSPVPGREVDALVGPLTGAEAKALDDRYEELKRMPAHLSRLVGLSDAELRARAADLGAPVEANASRRDSEREVLRRLIRADGLGYGEGVIEVLPDGYGFLRSSERSYLAGPDDVYVAPSQVRRFGLRSGSRVTGQIRPPKPSEKFPALLRVEAVDGDPPESAARRPRFEDLPAAHPSRRLLLASGPESYSARAADLFAPMGFGQRGLIVSPPRAGKTTFLSEIADGVHQNHPTAELLLLLVDERPEEAAELRKRNRGETIASTFDEETHRHLQVAELVLQRAKRLVEAGRDVVVLLDSLTRLARASNAETVSTGRSLSGGVDAKAMTRPKRFFGAARAIDGGGSLTVIATVLIDTGSRADQVIFEEFKGAGNMEIVLDRGLADRRVFPAIDVAASGTRKEELLIPPEELRPLNALRAALTAMDVAEATPLLLHQMKRTRTNAELLASVR